MKAVSAQKCICYGEMTHGGQAFVISDKNYSLAMLTKLNVFCVGQSREIWGDVINLGTQEVDFVLVISNPAVVIPSTEFFSNLFDETAMVLARGHSSDDIAEETGAAWCQDFQGFVIRIITHQIHQVTNSYLISPVDTVQCSTLVTHGMKI